MRSTAPPPRVGRDDDSDIRRARKASLADRAAFVARRRAQTPGISRREALAAELGARTALTIPEHRGLACAAPGTLDGVDDVVAAADAVLARVRSGELEGRRKGAMRKDLLHTSDLHFASPFLRFARSEGVVAPVSAYLGVIPILTYVDVWHSEHVAKAPFSSQLWHLDGADVRQIKVFVHCSDVGATSGPLTVVGAAASAALTRDVGYTFATSSRVDDDTVQRLLPAGTAAEPLTGPRGTAAFVDTSRCLHFGSRVEAGAPPRTVVVFQYLTPFGFGFEHDHREEAPFRELAEEASSECDRLLLGAA
ncbi:hypothetical protein LRS13_09130 [Svornostia abyssi]|uniref:Phytanoyl-CoA dioxygenase n=1 Tax=Svornostia abyssi TaxID=2898438 RepID=A0ABY5PLU5_9ACTN|nr:hypothetical protein LRS13_09130 [Parviterribacteraceae bacterium J379]